MSLIIMVTSLLTQVEVNLENFMQICHILRLLKIEYMLITTKKNHF